MKYLLIALFIGVTTSCQTMSQPDDLGCATSPERDQMCMITHMPKPATLESTEQNRERWGAQCIMMVRDGNGIYRHFVGPFTCDYKKGDVIK